MDSDLYGQYPFEYEPVLLRWMEERRSEVLPADLEPEARNLSVQLQHALMALFLHLGGLAVPTDLGNGTTRWEATWGFWNMIGKAHEVDQRVVKLDEDTIITGTSHARDVYFVIAVEALKTIARHEVNFPRWLDKFEKRVCERFVIQFDDADQSNASLQQGGELGSYYASQCFQAVREWLNGCRRVSDNQALNVNTWRMLCMPELEEIDKVWREIIH